MWLAVPETKQRKEFFNGLLFTYTVWWWTLGESNPYFLNGNSENVPNSAHHRVVYIIPSLTRSKLFIKKL